MDEIIMRFPVIAQQIFDQLSNKYLTNCKAVKPDWNRFVKGSRILLIRIIVKYSERSLYSFGKQWKKLIQKESCKNLRKIIIAMDQFYKKNNFRMLYQWSPHHVAADYGCNELYKFVIEKVGNENVGNENDVTPLHIAVQYGHQEISKLIVEHKGKST